MVTEYIQTGDSIMRIIELLEELGIDFDVASVSMSEEPVDYIKKFGDIFKKVYFGENSSSAGLSFYRSRDLGGIRKDDGSLSPHPEIVSLSDRSRLIKAREGIDFLAEEFFNKLLN